MSEEKQNATIDVNPKQAIINILNINGEVKNMTELRRNEKLEELETEFKLENLSRKYPYPYGFSLDCTVCCEKLGEYEDIIYQNSNDEEELKKQYETFIKNFDWEKEHGKYSQKELFPYKS